MKILLINPMASRKPPVKGRPAHFPVGIGLISSYLKQHGFHVDILDNETECLNKDELAEFIRVSDHDIYGITAMSPQYSYVKGLSLLIRRLKNKPIILGGPLATYSYKTLIEKTDVDICVIGEGEETMVDLLANMEDLSVVQGIAYDDGGKVVRNAARIFLKSRDEYPFPDYASFNMAPYFAKSLIQYEKGLAAIFYNPLKNPIGLRTIGIVTGMGCPYHCAFCSKSVSKIRIRSIDRIIEELRFLKSKYQIEGVSFMDELLIINEKRTLEFCDKIKPLNLIWSGQARANTLTDTIAKAMKGAGCLGVGIGLESGSERMLKAMRKSATLEQNENAMRIALKNKLIVGVQLLFGFPGENKQSIDETIDLFKRTEVPPRRFNVLTPLPGSALFDNALRDGLIESEDSYLEEVSKHEAGFGSKRVLLNLTDMDNKEFEELLAYAERNMISGFESIIKAKYTFWQITNIYFIALRFLVKLTKVVSPSVWSRKLKRCLGKDKGLMLDRDQIEEMYFNISGFIARGSR